MRSLVAHIALIAACSTSPDKGPRASDPFEDLGEIPDVEIILPEDPADALEGYACATDTTCEPSEALVDGTCCELGDAILHEDEIGGHETVGIETDGRFVAACGGFGAPLTDLADPKDPRSRGTLSERCQNLTFGPINAAGERLAWVTHHGDSWVSEPQLWAYAIPEVGAPILRQLVRSRDLLFEGLAYADGHLYVATHASGLEVYAVAEDGQLTAQARVGGFTNAREVLADASHTYVLDDDELVILARDTATDLRRVGALTLAAMGRDFDLRGDEIVVGLGEAGVEVVDISDRSSPTSVRVVSAGGSVQGVAYGDGFVTTASWDHVAVLDDTSWVLLGTERVNPYPGFEQDLAIAAWGDKIYVGEWLRSHVLTVLPDRIAPDVWIDEALISFAPVEGSQRTIRLQNRGPVPLSVDEILSDDPAFELGDTSFEVPAWGEARFTVRYHPSGRTDQGVMDVVSDDPDQAPFQVGLFASAGGRLKEGDTLTDDFAFLDPTGAEDLDNLRGNVWMLAYFALF